MIPWNDRNELFQTNSKYVKITKKFVVFATHKILIKNIIKIHFGLLKKNILAVITYRNVFI